MNTSIIVKDNTNDAAKFAFIQSKIYEIRGKKVMLDFELAKIYEDETRVLKQAVRRNIERFPADFMFQLTKEEWNELIANCDNLQGSIKYSPATPLAFTREGVAMLSGVLRSQKAIDANIDIMRAFVILSDYVLNYAELNHKLDSFMLETNIQFSEIYQILTEFAENKKEQEKPRTPIGFKQNK
jgi:2,3-bisphosphoglycerate-independent phosphoglycerate mutase